LSLSFAPTAAETSAGAWSHFLAWYRQLLGLVSNRISQVPGESVLCLCPVLRPRPVRLISPYRPTRCCPHGREGEGTNIVILSRLHYAALTLAAYASSSALLHSHARLATGCWLGFTGRELNPLNSDEGFPFYLYFPPSQIYPGATRRCLCQSFSACLDPYPGCSQDARSHFFSQDIGLDRSLSGSALHVSPTATSVGNEFRGCNHSLMFRPTDLLATQVAPTLTLTRRAAVAFTSAPITVRYLPVQRIC
jgi:hypothetical protein